jgi:hypothetical protein
MVSDALARIWLALVGGGMLVALVAFAIHAPLAALAALIILLCMLATAVAIERIGRDS